MEYLLAPEKSATAYRNVDPTAAALPVLREYLQRPEQPVLLLLPELSAAENLYGELSLLGREFGFDFSLRLLSETVRGKMVVAGGESARARELLAALTEPTDILIGSAHALTAAAPPPELIRNSEIRLKVGGSAPMAELLEKLVRLDYDDELEVAAPGEFARRGGIIDVFSPAHDQPCRIEYFGDEVDSLRLFSPETQRSTGEISEYRIIAPHPSVLAEKEGESRFDFFDYWSDRDYRLLAIQPEFCGERLEKYSGADCRRRLERVLAEKRRKRRLVPFHDPAGGADEEKTVPVGCYPPLAHLGGAGLSNFGYGAIELMREALAAQLRQWLDSGYEVVLLAGSDESAVHLVEWRRRHGFEHPNLSVEAARLGGGALLPDQKLVLLTERELFTVNAFNKAPPLLPPEERYRAPSAEPEESGILGDLDEGDYAVHLDHGIGIFRGIEESSGRGVKREAMKIEYRDGAVIHVPLDQAGLVSRYIGAAGKVRLHDLGSARWLRDKAAAGRSVNAYAADLLRLQAVRASSPGIAFPPDSLESRLFENEFPYEDTPDQKRTTVEIRNDMEKARPMDRLLCGDVGYGKTELAMRAAFKAVSAGYQVAVLAPTTVLTQQHYYSFRERFAEYPFVIESLSRFRTPAEQAEVVGRLKTGGVDIVIGTHRLCNPEIRFGNLGLLVIDEEQRFGVRAKEQLRRFRADVDVLTMSATPIPRTLYLAMAGARDLSTLQTAPSERLPVRTVVAPEDDALIVNVIRAELERGGQVYFLHNRVQSIDRRCAELAELLPEVRFGVAHGRLEEEDLARVMTEFLEHKIDCLFCTTIVESGLDVPGANTIIIERADRFGLAELYQLRGRVGRRHHQAYAYLLLPKGQLVTGDARKRIAAIRRCSQLGAGLQLALRDLEIRGAGNILGAEQSGHLNSIGFELYCRLLKNEVAKLRGEKPEFLPEAEIAVDFIRYGHEMPEGILPASFPPDYIEGVRLRLAAYRRLGTIANESRLENFRSELIDRYGKLPAAAENLFSLAALRLAVRRAGYDSLVVADGTVMLQKNGRLYRRRGEVPRIDCRNPPVLRLAILRDLVRQAAGESGKGE